MTAQAHWEPNQNTRLASEAPFPYGWPGLVLYMEQRNGTIEQISGRPDLRDAVRRALSNESTILAAWPGQWRTDLFVIDKPKLLADALHL